MNDKYKITGEELNQILMHSPHALRSSPYEKGMSGEQVKRYFYDFIRILIQKLNLHLEDVDSSFQEADESLSLHNTSSLSHQDIREMAQRAIDLCDGLDFSDFMSKDDHISDMRWISDNMNTELLNHNESRYAHQDIREEIENLNKGLDTAFNTIGGAYSRAEAAYNLAFGKTKVYISINFRALFEELRYNEAMNEGDIIMVTEKGTPDFVVASSLYRSVATEITEEMVITGNLPHPVVGEIYYYVPANKTLIAIESGVDASAFATKEELNSLIEDLSEALTVLHSYAVYLKEGEL